MSPSTEICGHPQTHRALLVAYNILRLVADNPGQYGRFKVARVMIGLRPYQLDDEEWAKLQAYALSDHLQTYTVQMMVRLVDSLIAPESGLLVVTKGDRPRLCLTRAGFKTLIHLEGIFEAE